MNSVLANSYTFDCKYKAETAVEAKGKRRGNGEREEIIKKGEGGGRGKEESLGGKNEGRGSRRTGRGGEGEEGEGKERRRRVEDSGKRGKNDSG